MEPVRALRSVGRFTRLVLPWSAQVLLPDSGRFRLVRELREYHYRRLKARVILDLPMRRVVRVPGPSYYYIDREPVKLKGRRRKNLGG